MKAPTNPAMRDLEDLFQEQLRHLFAAEAVEEEASRRLGDSASTPALRDTLHRQAKQAAEHKARLEEVFSSIGLKPTLGDVRGLATTAESCNHLLSDGVDPAVRDAAIIGTVQSLEHAEIAGYGCANAWARQLGHTRAAQLLTRTLEEEKRSDRRLSEIAELVNPKAAHRKAGTPLPL